MNAQTLKLFRQTAGLSQRDLAEKAGVSKALVGFIENGQRQMTQAVKLRLLQAIRSVTGEQISLYEQLSTEMM